MDRETDHELKRLLHGFTAALDAVRFAADDDARVRAWHQVRTLGYELNELLPGIEQPTGA